MPRDLNELMADSPLTLLDRILQISTFIFLPQSGRVQPRHPRVEAGCGSSN